MTTQTPDPPAEVNPYAPPAAGLEPDPEKPLQEGRAIGGWLILLALGIIYSMVQAGRDLFQQIAWALGPEGHDVLTGRARVLVGFVTEQGVTAVLMLGAGVVFWFFVKRSRRTPRLYIGVRLADIAATVVTSLAIPSLAYDNLDLAEGWGQVIRAVIPAAAWIPYFLKSKRVRETFVR